MAEEKFISKHTSTEIEAMLDKVKQDMQTIQYTQSEINTLLTKINNMSQPTKTSDLTNDSGFITNTVNNLINYYLKTETYSKTEVNTLINQQASGGFLLVNELPTTNISTNNIYLVPSTTTKTKNIKDEYINLDGTTDGWELIGDTKINLSDYVTLTALNTALTDYVSTASFQNTLASYYTKTEVDTTIGNLNNLQTTNKTNLVEAINEANTNGSSNTENIQKETMPVASANNEGTIIQYIGATNENYINGHFYKCTSDNESTPTYSWVPQEVQENNSNASGHTIIDSSNNELTDRGKLKFGGDFSVTDDSTNDTTVVAPHRITSEEMQEIISPLPAAQRVMPILFDETGAEYVVGWYKRASDGKKKPVYQKTVVVTDVTFSDISTTTKYVNLLADSNVELLNSYGFLEYTWNNTHFHRMVNSISYNDAHTAIVMASEVVNNLTGGVVQLRIIQLMSSSLTIDVSVTLEYTKTTDTWE